MHTEPGHECHPKNSGWSGSDGVLLGLREERQNKVSKSLENFGSGMIEDGNVHARESEDCVVPQERHHASVHMNRLLYNKGCRHATGSGKR